LHPKKAGIQMMQESDSKGGGFAATGLGLNDDVFALKYRGQALRLHGRHRRVTEPLQRLELSWSKG
jgi:hypothetical protein